MEAITRIENILTEQPDRQTNPPEDSIQALEQFIDRMVTAENKLAQASAQAAIKSRQIREEFEKRIAFLSSRLHEAESALAALEASLSRGVMSPSDHELLNSKKGEVVYWRTRLHEVCPPDPANIGI